MRSNSTKASRWAMLLALSAAGVAACSQGLTDSASRHSRVVLNVRSLLGAVIGGDFLTVADTAHLTIASAGAERTLTQLLGPGDDETTFDVTVEEGTARFSVDVISSNGTPLYQGETSATIDADGFAVSITPQAINPVMVVFPRRPTFDTTTIQFDSFFLREFDAVVRVRNAGLDTLRWRVDSLVQLPAGVAVFCFIPSFEEDCRTEQLWVGPTNVDVHVGFRTPTTTVLLPTQGIRFVSNVGTATLPTVP
jgi:hypothetical protein